MRGYRLGFTTPKISYDWNNKQKGGVQRAPLIMSFSTSWPNSSAANEKPFKRSVILLATVTLSSGLVVPTSHRRHTTPPALADTTAHEEGTSH